MVGGGVQIPYDPSKSAHVTGTDMTPKATLPPFSLKKDTQREAHLPSRNFLRPGCMMFGSLHLQRLRSGQVALFFSALLCPLSDDSPSPLVGFWGSPSLFPMLFRTQPLATGVSSISPLSGEEGGLSFGSGCL